MRFLNTKVTEDKKRRDNGDFQVIIEGADMFNQDQSGFQQGVQQMHNSDSLSIIDNPNILMQKVNEMSNQINFRLNKQKDSEIKRIEQQNYKMLQQSLNNNIIQVTNDRRSYLKKFEQKRKSLNYMNNGSKPVSRSPSKIYHKNSDVNSSQRIQSQDQLKQNRNDISVFFEDKIQHFKDEASTLDKGRGSIKSNEVRDQDQSHFDLNDKLKQYFNQDLNQQQYSGSQSLIANQNKLIQSQQVLSPSFVTRKRSSGVVIGKQQSNYKLDKLNGILHQSTANKQFVVRDMGKQVLNDLLQDQLKKASPKHHSTNVSKSREQQKSFIKDSYKNKVPSKYPSQLYSQDGSKQSKRNRPEAQSRQSNIYSSQNQSRIMSPKSAFSTEKLFGDTDKKVKFYNQAKEYQNMERKGLHLTSKSINMDLLKNLQLQNVIPIPILVRLDKQVLNLIGYQMNEGLAISLGKTLQQIATRDPKKHVKEAYFDGNGLKDSSFGVILKGLNDHQNFRKLQCSNNEVGALSLESIGNILQKKKPLQELKFSSINLGDSKILTSISIIIKKSENLKDLELSWASLLPPQLEQIDLSGMSLKKNIEKLYNCLKQSKSLLAIHLSNNDIPMYQMDKLFQELDVISTKKHLLDHDFLVNHQHQSDFNIQSNIEIIESDKELDDYNEDALLNLQINMSQAYIRQNIPKIGSQPVTSQKTAGFARNTRNLQMKIHVDQKPIIAGNFNEWHFNQMIRVHEFAMLLDPKLRPTLQGLEDPFKVMSQLLLDESILSEYKSRWRSIMKSNFKYEKHTTFVNFPQQNDVEYDDQIGQDLFVFAGFMKPGKQTLVIKDFELNCQLTNNKKKVANCRVFKKELSVFKDWKEDNVQTLQKMFDLDIQCWKVPRFINSCIHFLKEHYFTIKKLFTYYAASSSYPTISMIDFSTLCNQMQILDKAITLSTLDRLFIATNVELVEMDENPDKELCRFEMLEILVRIAGAKYKETGITKTYSEALQMLLENHVLPHCQGLKWQEFRDEELWCLEVNDTLEANIEGLKKLFNYFGKVSRGFINLKEAISMIKLANLEITDKDITFCYAMSKIDAGISCENSLEYIQE
eukprot:403369687